MANTVHGPFTPGAATSTGPYGTGVGQSNTYTSGNANNAATQSAVALASFNPDLITAAFILSGVACVKDATTASQLNITSGEAYVLMSDGTYARIDVAATTQSASGHASSTLYLYLQPDGTWYWNTANSPAANSLAICTVTTDGSSNISGVTDKRVTLAQALTGAAHPSAGQPGGLLLPAPLSVETTQSAAYAATVVGGVTFGQVGALRGSFDTAALFNGTTGYINVPTSGLPSGMAAFTLEGWVKLSAYPASAGPLWVLGQTGNRAFLQVNSAGTVTVGTGANVTSGSAISLNAWHHLAATWDGTTLTLYVDGASAGTATTTQSITYGVAYLGQSLSGAFLSGLADECAVYGAALSSARITAHYNAALAVTSDAYATTVLADAPLRYYRLGDAVGASLAASATSPTTTTLVNADGTLPSVAFTGGGAIDHEGAFVVYRSRESGASADGHLFQTWNGSTSSNAFGVGTAAVASVSGTALNDAGVFAQIAGQTTAGSFGAPVIVAQTVDQHITATTATTLLTFTAPVAGLYRASLYVLVSGSGNPSTLTAKATFTDRNGGPQTGFFTIQTFTAGATNPATLNSASVATANCISAFPVMGYVKAGGTCQIIYQNATATPNDYASAMIERLS